MVADAKLAVVVFSWWEIALSYLQLVVVVLLRQLWRALDYQFVRNALCLVGLGPALASVADKSLLACDDDGSRFAKGNQKPHRKFLLPPRREEDRDKLTVVLDLDETLVCAYNSAGLPSSIHHHALSGGVRWFQLQCTASEKENGEQGVTCVTVYERPGLLEFLRRASRFAELVLFTAGLEGYARPLVDRIDPEGKISARLYRPATVSTRYREHVKDLSTLGRDLRRTVLVDNNPFSFILQPVNGIPCVPFTGEQPEDRQLLDVLLPLLENLSRHQDVRPVLQDRFRMPVWFRNRGIPTADAIL
ncbi:hypothetical protein CBR_g4587 [Chara braunii]|uniref:FCP1 homology domain-containing protein n=1 Tax=Chara braunii TaxID=69332 RepID=A0A388KI99_CHABU|nr:hypothetical protein CBR_g4587 [Chara braunii]|eukprot:GBG69756.1 hypothetical protein CBR_g4587 [Chara braunii]